MCVYKTGTNYEDGTEIYNEDIVEEFIEDKEGDTIMIEQVTYKDGCYWVDGETLNLCYNRVKVVGNPYDNPELIDKIGCGRPLNH